MNYEEFDIGNFEDETCTKILNLLKTRPMSAYELAKEIFGEEEQNYKLSPKLQKLKGLGMVSNVKDKYNFCYWGVEEKYRKIQPSGKGDKK